MQITLEMLALFLAALGVIGGGAAFVGTKLSALTESLNNLKETLLKDYVSHEMCQERQAHCRCLQVYDGLREDIEEVKANR